MKYLAFRPLCTALIKAELYRAVTVKLEINTLFTPRATYFLAIFMTLLDNFWIFDVIVINRASLNGRLKVIFLLLLLLLLLLLVRKSMRFTRGDIAKIIKNFHPNKAHRHGMISVQKLKLFGESVLASFQLIFTSCLQSWTFSSEWLKKQVTVEKSGGEQFLQNHWLISLLLFCEKIFERLIYDKIIAHFIENDLISHNQLVFKSRDYCINHCYLLLMR